MFDFFGKLFGTEKAMTSVVDGVKNGLDALVYTDEEQAQAAAADRSEARKMVVAWMASTQGQNLARRLLALAITGVWLMQYLIAQLFMVLNVFMDRPVVNAETGVTDFMQAAQLIREGATTMNSAVMLILAFYFAAPHMGDIANAAMGKFKKSVNKG